MTPLVNAGKEKKRRTDMALFTTSQALKVVTKLSKTQSVGDAIGIVAEALVKEFEAGYDYAMEIVKTKRFEEIKSKHEEERDGE